MKPALLIVDVQTAFLKIDSVMTQSLDKAIRHINAAIPMFRERRLPVICVQHMNPKGGLVPGAEGFDLPDQLNVLASDAHIHKTYGNAFNRTSLEEELRKAGVDTVIVTGFAAEHCVLSTCRGAQDRDLTAIVLRGSIASGIPDNIPFVESICEVISLGALKKVLEQQ